ncbi:MAG: hypothetical protein ACE5JP_16620 [Candidatus Bipolaricaulia bacterium]
MSGKIRLKRARGWFAAGREWQQALERLSDGAFKLFVYVSLQAGRRSRRLSFHQRELAQALGKSRRSIQHYLEELVEKQVCRILSARNQYTSGVVEIRPEYWPYVSEHMSAAEDPCLDEDTYVEAVGKMFLSQPCVRSAYSAADRRLARAWFGAGVSLTLVEQAILLGCGRKYVSWLNAQPSEPIGSLAFFKPLLEEISGFELSLEYQSFNRYQTEKYKLKWLAAAASPRSSKAAPAGAKVAQAKAARNTETR